MLVVVAHAAKDLRLENRDLGNPSQNEVVVELERGGICGSDLHYYNHGGVGQSIRLKEPMILGHEVAGRISAIGEDIAEFTVGDRVAVSPSRPCGACQYCSQALFNHCENMRFYGSAMPYPHIQGAFRQTLIADAAQCVVANELSAAEAAMSEPLSVCLHAVNRAGDLKDKRILITGSGPIGALSILAANAAGAGEIVVTDIADEALSFASKVGAHEVINTVNSPSKLQQYQDHKGYFDVAFECSGADSALASCIDTVKPRGVVVQLGLGGDMNVPVQTVTAKEIDLRGSFRFHEEFKNAVSLMTQRVIDVKPLVTHTYPLQDTINAFETASDRRRSMKVQIDFAASA